jgi:hypothetical protein
MLFDPCWITHDCAEIVPHDFVEDGSLERLRRALRSVAAGLLPLDAGVLTIARKMTVTASMRAPSRAHGVTTATATD